MRTCIATLALTGALMPARASLADPPSRGAESRRAAEPSPKRKVTNYRGRPEPSHTAADAALWIPRVLLSPLYLVAEYGLREPLSVVIPAAEKAEVPRKVYDFFTWGPQHKAGFVPVGFFDFDFNPSVGVYAFWHDALAKGNDFTLHTEAWPADWYAFVVHESVRLDQERQLELKFLGTHRPDRVFYGIGPRSLLSSQSRYTEAVTDESATLDWKHLRALHLRLTTGLRSESDGPGSYEQDPSLEKEAATHAFAIPYGYGRRYTAEYNGVVASLDSRPYYDEKTQLPPPGSGARLEIKGEQGSDMIGSSGWIRYGAEGTAFVDLDQHQRVVSLSVLTELADPLGARPIPFTELVSLGGSGPMSGYFAGRLRDRSAAVAALRYTWPIGPWIGGKIEAALGNVFGEHLQGFRPPLLRFAGQVGVTALGVSEYPVQAIVGLGSETFEQGGRIDSARVTISVNHGF